MATLQSLELRDDDYLMYWDAVRQEYEKINAGYADKSGHADDASAAAKAADADKWGGHAYADMLDQPVRTTDVPTFKSVKSDTFKSSDYFPGITGSGMAMERNADGSTLLTVDKIIARSSLTVATIVAEEVKSTGGVVVVSAANGKVSFVEVLGEDTYGPGRVGITIEGGTTFVAGDIVQWGAWDAAHAVLRAGKARVESAMATNSLRANGYLILKDLTTDTLPATGDMLVLMGSSVAGRQSAIVISSEDGAEAVTVYAGIDSLTAMPRPAARFGSLAGITDTLLGNLSGYGLWADNAWLRGSVAMANADGSTLTLNAAGDPAMRVGLPDGSCVRYGYAEVNGLRTVAQHYSADGTIDWVTPADGAENMRPVWELATYYVANPAAASTWRCFDTDTAHMLQCLRSVGGRETYYTADRAQLFTGYAYNPRVTPPEDPAASTEAERLRTYFVDGQIRNTEHVQVGTPQTSGVGDDTEAYFYEHQSEYPYNDGTTN